MAFDPTKPVENSPLDAAEMRNQLNALKALIDAQQVQITGLQTALALVATAPTLAPLNPTLHEPPVRADLYAVRDYINALVNQLQPAS